MASDDTTLGREYFPYATSESSSNAKECRFEDMAANAIKKVMPLLDRILVQRAEPMATTEGGIVLPEGARSKMMRGTVIAVGPGARNSQNKLVTPLIKRGDQVLLPGYGGTRVKMEDGKEYHIFRESDILAKYE
uniref:10 kDa heat shock protein, mitochondrial n=1 Tax=Glossina austeni TaxID=7395 RepID=A0A1A9ULQ9_GLOAU